MGSRRSPLVALLDELEQQSTPLGDPAELRLLRDRLNEVIDGRGMPAAEFSASPRFALGSGQGPPSDFWERRWADRSLQNLGQWLTAHLHDEAAAEQAVSRVWSFYSYFVIPAYGGYPLMALSAKDVGDRRDVALHLPKLAATVRPQGRFGDELGRDLQRYERRPVAPDLQLFLDLTGADERDLEQYAIAWCEARQRHFLGVYRDDLAAELANVFHPRSFDEWLETPKEQLGNRKPIDLLHESDQDHLLRDLVLDVKYSLIA